MNPDLNLFGSTRTELYDKAVVGLNQELTRRLNLLESRKADCAQLQEFSEFLAARGWQASAAVAALAYTDNVQLQLAVTVENTKQCAELLSFLAAEGIEVARHHAWDIASDHGYELTLSGKLKVAARIALARAVAKPVEVA